MKKSFFMLCALAQITFASQLVEGKYVNFEDYATNITDYNGENAVTLSQYKNTYVNGTNSTRHYVTNEMLQNAFNAATSQKAQGVFLPPGVWNFKDQIVVPHGMTLKGSYDRPHNVTSTDLYVKTDSNGDDKVTWSKTGGTNIACFQGWNWQPAQYNMNVPDADACIALQGTATLDGVNVHYPQQAKPTKNSFSAIPYPWTISCQSGRNDRQKISRCAVMNTTLVNSYAGIDLSGTNDFYIKGVNMTALMMGMRLDYVTSQGAIEDVNIHTQFSVNYYGIEGHLAGESTPTKKYNKLEGYIESNMTGIEFRWTDWEWLNNVFIYKANKGFYFKRGAATITDRPLAAPDIQNSGCDQCVDAVYVEEGNTGIGINFSNCNLLGGIVSGANNYGTIRFTNSYLEFNAGKDKYFYMAENGKNYYRKNHIEVGQHTTMQITNSEIVEFMGDVDPSTYKKKGLWLGSTFNVNGNLLLNNSVIVWSEWGNGFNGVRYNDVQPINETGTIGSYPKTEAQHFTFNAGSKTMMDNILFRGHSVRSIDNSSGNSQSVFANVLLDLMPTGYHRP